ncbi:tRNA (N6-isopentenyl adenosine(37)-C2)-methylthiotransferase MiaB [Candidatus Marinamargulisbacteria bacterium SCGC AG-414-C22]|nr:tRNA (N6-isopentenyl adenosine(37)-C2)-methylthiotransferase MiaB [Candidatus Marinamargulisbacteria bacterium SCGC AG-414-C22]
MIKQVVKPKSVFIETYGCQMNVYDTELIKSILLENNFSIAMQEDGADIVMLNTCSVRDNANRKIYNRVHEIKQANKDAMIGVLGCMATNFKTDLLENSRLKIDFIAGPDSYKTLPTLINSLQFSGEKQYDVTLSEFETYSDIYPTRQGGVNAWIAIMRGCNNFCTFCVVPYTRGRERSREPQNIVEEVKKLVRDGYKQVTLLGQNVNSYKYDNYDFTDLMKMVSDVEGVERIRYTSPHPKDFPKKLIKLMSERDNICKQIHMPLQAGNDRVLHKMNRSYTKEEFLNLVTDIRHIIPDIAISTDIILGFPTETEAEFLDTVDVVEKVQFDSAFIFKYSERPNTRAAQKFPDDVTEAEKKDRIIRLNDIQNAISMKKNNDLIGTTKEVLIEELKTKRSENEVQGRTDCNRIVILPKSNQKMGDLSKVNITGATRNVLKGI